MNILIGNAWPYANGSLHIGHIAALLPGDVLARYHRLKGDNVQFVSGSDCHGTPVAIRARQENKTPKEISDYYNKEFEDCFRHLGFSYDLYGKTSSEEHRAFVTDFHEKLYKGGYVYQRSTPQAFCQKCNQFLPDRFVNGLCPNCGKPARGDQCESCGSVLEPENLVKPKCSTCGEPPEFRSSNHLYLAATRLLDELDRYVESHSSWRTNAYETSKRYIREGLRDRSLSRDLDWGINVPKEGFEDKKIYIWAENVLGYLSDSHTLCRQNSIDFLEFWNSCKQYYVHGKDNIPFHTIILPSLLLGRTDAAFKLPDEMISSEYLTLEGRKISTSSNWAIWAKDIIKRYNADSIRYFLLANGPEKRDTDFTWREFVNSHNAVLLGAYGNLVNRCLVFIQKNLGNKVPVLELSKETKESIESIFSRTGHLIENGEIKDALDVIFSLVRDTNKYFDNEQPWITLKTNIDKCRETLFNCVQIIANLSILLEPFLPFTSEKVKNMLGITSVAWQYTEVPPGQEIEQVEILFDRIDKKNIQEEDNLLKMNS